MKFVFTRPAEENLTEIYLYGLLFFGPIQAFDSHTRDALMVLTDERYNKNSTKVSSNIPV